MKNLNIAYYLSCCLLVTILFSCEKTDFQKSLMNDHNNIGFRNVPDDCNNCPVNDCCCSVVWTSGPSPTTLTFCGTDDPDVSASECEVDDVGVCNDIMGYTVNRTVSSTDPRKAFCMQQNSVFGITGTAGVHLTITCQYGQINPQSYNVVLGTDKAYFNVNGDCELEPCF